MVRVFADDGFPEVVYLEWKDLTKKQKDDFLSNLIPALEGVDPKEIVYSLEENGSIVAACSYEGLGNEGDDWVSL